MRIVSPLAPAILAVFILLLPVPAAAWSELDIGLDFQAFDAPIKSDRGDSKIVVLRIDPKFYEFRLLCAEGEDVLPMPVYEWAEKYGLVAVINASMYLKDGLTSTGYMRNARYVNNPTVNKRFGSFLLFDPNKPGLPSVQLIDRHFHDWEGLLKEYNSVVQNFRMLSADRRNLWSEERERASVAAVAQDGEGRILFLHAKSPYTVHDFNECVLSLPLDVRGMMYVEGGPEAAMYVTTPSFSEGWGGMYSIGFYKNQDNVFYSVPNVLGVVRKP